MRVIPAIDLLNGQVVRLKKGDYEQVTVYSEHPLEEARKFQKAGFSHIHVVDLNGAREGTFVNLAHIREIKNELGISIQTGGGVRSFEDAERLFEAGVQKVICSSMAVKNTSDWLRLLEQYPERAILGMDLKEGKVAYGGWEKTLNQTVAGFLQPMLKQGLQTILCTDISRDGMLSGPNTQLYHRLQKRFQTIDIIASGGVSDEKDLAKLESMDIFGVVVGRAYYEHRLSLKAMQKYHSE